MMEQQIELSLTVTGEKVTERIPSRLLLGDFLRDRLGIASNHFGCEHGVCGACTIRLDGRALRSCLMFAVQVDGCRIDTAAGLADETGELNDLQKAFRKHHALQCGYCTPGILMSVTDFLGRNPEPSEEEIKDMLSGHICRCTGYVGMVRAVQDVVQQRNQGIS